MRILTFVFLSITVFSFGQTPDDNLVFWSPTRKLTVEDFGIKTSNHETYPSFAQFSVDYRVGGFDFMARNLNKRVRNYLIRSASTIDTTADVSALLRYQQTLFDMCEIYTRQFRKALKENKRKVGSSPQFVDSLNQKAMTDFANRRVLYDRQTNFGTMQDKQIEWEKTIARELASLQEFASE